MSDSELREFNSLLREHKKDPEFSERFATRMGGRGTLEFWEGMNLHADPAPEGARKELLEQTRTQLGATLGTATQSDSKAMQEWKADVIAAGPYSIDHDLTKPRGFQVMSDLMNSGRYDDAFLKDYGKALIDYEKDATERGDSLSEEYLGKTIPGSGLDGGDIDLTNDWGTDPMTGYMNALGHNHQASTEFFSDKGNFDYVVGGEGVKGARDWPEDAHPQYESGTSRGYDALGHALESATTGTDYGAANPELHRGEEERAVMQRVMERYGSDDKDLMDNQSGIADSMGRMGAAYVDDLNYGLAGYRMGRRRPRRSRRGPHRADRQGLPRQRRSVQPRAREGRGLEAGRRVGGRGRHHGCDRRRIRGVGSRCRTHLIPIAEAGGTAAETALGNDISDALKESERDSTNKAVKDMDDFFDRARGQARSGIDQYMDQRDVSLEDRRRHGADLTDAYNRGRDMTDTDNAR